MRVMLCLVGMVFLGCSAGPGQQSNDFLNPKDSIKPPKQDGNNDDDSFVRSLSYWAFGGMYSDSGDEGYVNPVTEDFSCPSGYDAVQAFGSEGEDANIIYCKRDLSDDELPIYDFGGMYGFHSAGKYENPVTGETDCPSGFESHKIFGDNDRDFSLYFCARTPVEDEDWTFSFGGMFGDRREGGYANPATNQQSCPSQHQSFRVLGSSNVDWPLSFCIESMAGERFKAVDESPNVDFLPEYDRGLLGFGGMYSQSRTNPLLGFVNPSTGAFSCPAGYLEHPILGRNANGSVREDWDVVACYRDDMERFELAEYDFGGMFGFGTDFYQYKNPFTNAMSCPAGFSEATITDATNIDWKMSYCYRPQQREVPTPYSYGGFWGETDNNLAGAYPNIVPYGYGCPAEYVSTKVHGASYSQVDARLNMCTREININSN